MSIEQIIKTGLETAEKYMRETYALDAGYEVDSFKINDKSVEVSMTGPRSIALKGKIPISVLYPPHHPGQTAMFEGGMTGEEKADLATSHVDGDTPECPCPCSTCIFYDEKLDDETDAPILDDAGNIVLTCTLVYADDVEACGGSNSYKDYEAVEQSEGDEETPQEPIEGDTEGKAPLPFEDEDE